MKVISDNRPFHFLEIMGLPDEFVEHGTVAELKYITGIDTAAIKKAIRL